MRVRGWRGWSSDETLRSLRQDEHLRDAQDTRETEEMEEDTDTEIACAFRDLTPEAPSRGGEISDGSASDSENSEEDICEQTTTSLDALDVSQGMLLS